MHRALPYPSGICCDCVLDWDDEGHKHPEIHPIFWMVIDRFVGSVRRPQRGADTEAGMTVLRSLKTRFYKEVLNIDEESMIAHLTGI